MKTLVGSILGIIIMVAVVLPFVIEINPQNYTVSIENGFYQLNRIELNGTHTLIENNTLGAEVLNHAFTLGNVLMNSGTYTINETVSISRNYALISGETGVKIVFEPLKDIEVLVIGHDITFRDIEIQGNGFNSFGVRVLGDHNTLLNLTVHDVGATTINGFGICSDYGVSNCLIENSTVYNTGLDGIHLRQNSNSIVRNCIIYQTHDDGIATILSSNSRILNCTIDKSFDSWANCIRVCADEGTLIAYNTIWNASEYGINAGNFGGLGLNSRVILRQNTVSNCTLGDYFIEGDVIIE